MSNSPGSTATTQQASNWLLPYQQNAVNQAQAQYDSVSSPTQLVAPLSSQQNQAITGITNLATNGSSEENAANNYVTNVLSGSPANNPYLSSEFQLGANQVQNQLESEFAGSGANVLSSLPVQSDELNNLATQLYGGAYNTGVQQQESAASLAPTLDTQQYSDLSNLYGAGSAVQNLAQEYIQAPQTFLANYANLVNQPQSNSAVTVQNPSSAQQLATALQNANLGNTAGSAVGNLIGGLFGSSSTGSSVGGILGALLGGTL